MQLIFPKILGSERLDTVISLISSMREEKEISVDWSKVREVEPAALSILSIITDQAIEKNCKVVHKNLRPSIKSMFPKICFNYKLNESLPKPNEYEVINPVSFSLCCQGGIDLRYKELLLKYIDTIGEDLSFSIQLVFNELIQNAVDHSTSERYYLYFGLHHSEVHFGVLDMGVSLPAKMEQKYSVSDDIKYLELSLKEGISTRRQRTGGLGLFHTFEMIKNLKGKFVFISRDGQIRRYFSQRKVNRMELKKRLNGTWVLFTFEI